MDAASSSERIAFNHADRERSNSGAGPTTTIFAMFPTKACGEVQDSAAIRELDKASGWVMTPGQIFPLLLLNPKISKTKSIDASR